MNRIDDAHRAPRKALLAALACVAGLALPAAPASALSKGTALDVTKCAWTFEADGRTTGLGFIDTNVGYRDTPMFTGLPGGHWQFRGQYPKARWISFESYDRFLASQNAISGPSIDPANPLLRNPYRVGGTAKPGDRYTVDMYDRPPSKRVPDVHNVLYGGYRMNPMYGGLMHEETQSVIYRVYDAARSVDTWGGVPDPRMYWIVDDPATNPFPTAATACASLRLANAEYQPWPTTMDSLNAIDRPLLKPFVLPVAQQLQVGAPSTNDQPQYAVFRPNSNGYQNAGINSKASYFGLSTNRPQGPLLVIHFKAPTFWHQGGRPITGKEQLAYWSWCSVQYLTPLNYTVGCLRDNQFQIDPAGYVTMVVSTPADRPVINGRPFHNWVIMAGNGGLTVMRFNDANRGTFPQSPYYMPQINVGVDLPADLLFSASYDAQIKAHMGQYFPRMKYCTVAQFKQDHCGFA